MNPPYATPAAFRAALEQRLLNQAKALHVNLERLRRQVVFERLVARIETADPGAWVLKGAMALEVRLGSAARATMDLDLGLRVVDQSLELGERLRRACSQSAGDPFAYRLVDIRPLNAIEGGELVRARVECRLAGRPFGRLQVDVALRPGELHDTERLRLHGHLRFAGIEAPDVEVVSVARHVAEKLHAMLTRFADRENTRVRDLADLVILREHGLIDPTTAAAATRRVFAERQTALPSALPVWPEGWPTRYVQIAAEHRIGASTFERAVAVVDVLWSEMFPPTRKDSD